MTNEPVPSSSPITASPLLRLQLDSACAELLKSVEVPGPDQVRFLNTVERILETAKLEALAEFAAGAGHEINNPVATIVGRAQLLLSNEPDPNRAQGLQIIGGQALRIRDMIGDVMLFARPPQPKPEFLSLPDLIRKAEESQRELILQRQAEIQCDITQDLEIWADRTQTLVLLSSLLRNCLESGDQTGIQIRIAAVTEMRNDVEWAAISIEDDGPGISAAIRDHLFAPFFSGRQAGRGLGFGLTKCWRIVQMHGGTIEIVPLSSGHTRFEIGLPLPTG